MQARCDNGGLRWCQVRPFYLLLFGGLLVTIAALAAVAWVFISTGSSMTGLRMPTSAARNSSGSAITFSSFDPSGLRVAPVGGAILMPSGDG